ncbi:FKBP-type peptidyl-prolyl cis-trans isomerase [Prevotella dentasini]|uniref:FKBP-type peptidyl-prolyl cis-trans isomerase n=1 Tax=Prevotella dentasini TaxID=589537 RepID=UPI00046A201A|nr:FKBP-type peptidyl-prolyl cis-trans isomerase [Prevotella dentasini]
MMKMRKFMLRHTTRMLGVFALLLSAGLFASCSESDNTVEEYAGWKAKNENYWDNLYRTTQQKIAEGDRTWQIILNYSYQNQTGSSESPLSYGKDKYIIVHTLATSNSMESPLYTDSVQVHYQGRLIPSETYTAGLVFDSSWGGGVFDAETSKAAGMRVSKLVDGFSTALQAMHLGDHWVVYIPYQLGYGAEAKNDIPAYSSLIFDVQLSKIIRR